MADKLVNSKNTIGKILDLVFTLFHSKKISKFIKQILVICFITFWHLKKYRIKQQKPEGNSISICQNHVNTLTRIKGKIKGGEGQSIQDMNNSFLFFNNSYIRKKDLGVTYSLSPGFDMCYLYI